MRMEMGGSSCHGYLAIQVLAAGYPRSQTPVFGAPPSLHLGQSKGLLANCARCAGAAALRARRCAGLSGSLSRRAGTAAAGTAAAAVQNHDGELPFALVPSPLLLPEPAPGTPAALYSLDTAPSPRALHRCAPFATPWSAFL